jgi:hypothetical protein
VTGSIGRLERVREKGQRKGGREEEGRRRKRDYIHSV